ncbi:Dabb family protein [Streptomyces sp. GESEQ-35]|uniref:Dabb family protein n=1 Tax=Streptomyces sp. GESEQ-35 TaxID=2812657 RepID=UPI001B32E31E|nr:Dabb family protein [Streptomyces sp. GESEQ-35]
MIYHGTRIKLKEGITPEQFEEALEILHEQGRSISVVEDMNAYEEYLTHPAHTRSERFAFPLIEKFEAYDITDDPDPDPEFGAKVAELQRRHYETG